MRLTLHTGKKEDVETWVSVYDTYFRSVFSDEKKVGYKSNTIICRENLYRILERNYLITRVSGRSHTICASRFSYAPPETIKNLISTTPQLNLKFTYTDDGELINKKGAQRINPMAWSALILIIKKYSDYYRAGEPNLIPIKILDDILSTHISHYEIDFIFTAYYVYLLLHEGFNIASFYGGGHINSANGPGTGIYKNFWYINALRSSVDDGWGNLETEISRDWWKNPEIKERIYKIMELLETTDVEDKLLTIFMEV